VFRISGLGYRVLGVVSGVLGLGIFKVHWVLGLGIFKVHSTCAGAVDCEEFGVAFIYIYMYIYVYIYITYTYVYILQRAPHMCRGW